MASKVSWLRSAACACDDSALCRSDHDGISQYGRRDGAVCIFRNEPRSSRIQGMSVQAYRATAQQMCEHVLGDRATDADRDVACVRHTTVGALRAEGFLVIHTPGKIRNSLHCTVIFPGSPQEEDNDVTWTVTAARVFDACFNQQP